MFPLLSLLLGISQFAVEWIVNIRQEQANLSQETLKIPRE